MPIPILIGMGILVALLVLWVILAVLGFAIKGLFWLVVVAVILIVITGGFTYRRW